MITSRRNFLKGAAAAAVVGPALVKEALTPAPVQAAAAAVEADGPFVWLGMRPKFIIMRRIDEAGWLVTSATPPDMRPPGAEDVSLDLMQNGFKIRDALATKRGYKYVAYSFEGDNRMPKISTYIGNTP